MEVVTSYKDSKSLKAPIALTIGTFDGLHLGHQRIFHKLKELTHEAQGSRVVISFSNHPSEVLRPKLALTKITSTEEKIELFKELGIHLAILLEFTMALRDLSYEEFIHSIRASIPFDYLVLGQGAAFGKHQEGNEARLKALGKTLGFTTIYLDKLAYNDTPISSKLIREYLKEGDVEYIRNLLGRPYSFYAPFHLAKLQETGENRLKITFDFQNHCLIPSGHYIVNLKSSNYQHLAVAYLTTLVSDKTSKTFDLEVFIKGPKAPFMNDNIKVEFVRKIPSSKSFDDLLESPGKIEPINL